MYFGCTGGHAVPAGSFSVAAGASLVFASEIKALRALTPMRLSVDRGALTLFMRHGYVPGPLSIHPEVRKLRPGHLLCIDLASKRVDERCWWNARDLIMRARATPFEGNDEDATNALDQALLDSVRLRMVSDVPLGAFLSGGIDSSAVVAAMQSQSARPIKTFTIGFEQKNLDEAPYARAIARHLGTDHTEVYVAGDEARATVPQLAEIWDEPFADSSQIPTLLVSRIARRSVTVALSGDGGDELFGGYGRYRDTLNESTADARGFLARMKLRLRGQRATTVADRYLSPRWLMFQPDRVAQLLGTPIPPRAADGLRDWHALLCDTKRTPLQRMRALDAWTYMPGAVLAKVDRMSMQCSLEVRCPLLDRDLGRFAATLPDALLWQPPSGTKQILKELAMEYLPQAWMERRKMGFGLPAKCWSQAALLRLADESLGKDAALRDHLDGAALTAFVEEQRNPAQFSIYRLWPMLILELWLRERRSAH